MKENKEINAHSIVTVEDNLNEKIDGLKDDFEHKWDNLQDSIEDLINQQQCPPEDECLTETILDEQVQLQPQEELKVESLEAPEELQDAPVTFWPLKKEEQTSALISEEESQEEECLSDTMVEEQCQQHLLLEPSDIGATVCPWENHTALLSEEINGKEPGEVPKKNVIQPNPIYLDTTATAQDTKNPLLVPPSADLVYIQPPPAANSKHAAPKAKSNPLPAAPPDSVFILPMPAAQPKPQASTTKATPSLLVLQNIRRLVASVHTFATTSKMMAAAYMAWHSGWYWCGFGFGASEPRHF